MQPKSNISRITWKRKICSSSTQCREAKEFWSKLWDTPFSYREDAEWLKEIELELENVNIQENVEITKENVTMQLKKMPNWKAPGLDGIQAFWVKRFTSKLHRLTEELNENIKSLLVPSWLLKGRTVLVQKDPAECNAVGNYQPIAWLILLWKLKTDGRYGRYIITKYAGLHPRSKIKQLYLPRSEGGRGLVSTEDRFNHERENVALYALWSNEKLIIAVTTERKHKKYINLQNRKGRKKQRLFLRET